jgi:hypothetical protein
MVFYRRTIIIKEKNLSFKRNLKFFGITHNPKFN